MNAPAAFASTYLVAGAARLVTTGRSARADPEDVRLRHAQLDSKYLLSNSPLSPVSYADGLLTAADRGGWMAVEATGGRPVRITRSLAVIRVIEVRPAQRAYLMAAQIFSRALWCNK
jgi:hypothetical protein